MRNDVTLDFDWGTGSPAPQIPVDGFSARWSRSVDFAVGTYRFTWLSMTAPACGSTVSSCLTGGKTVPCAKFTVDVPLAAGAHALRLETYENVGQARARLHWEPVAPTYTHWKGEYWGNTGQTEPRRWSVTTSRSTSTGATVRPM